MLVEDGVGPRIARAFEFGCVWINCHIPLVAEMPHGGFKESGYGRDSGLESLRGYQQTKSVWLDLATD